MSERRYLACDLGAESGRVMLATVANGNISLEELHRFANDPVRLPTGLYWDMLRLFHEIVRGISKARGVKIDGIGIDTWGVDYALLGSDGALCDVPRHYRDDRNVGMVERTFAVVPKERIFERTGVQFMHINTLYQLHAARLENSPGLKAAKKLLFTPDLLNYWLCGAQKTEWSIASTSQFFDPRTRTWATDILEALDIPTHILPEIVPTGTKLGTLLPHVADLTGIGEVPVFATAGHDTAAAVAAVPAQGDDWCYISSGTWSLMGVLLPKPLINARALECNFTNEMAADGRVRFLKNIAGLWILQECRRAWAQAGQEYSYEQLTGMAGEAEPYCGYFPPDEFLSPGHMPERIAAWCRQNGQPVPEGVAAMTRAVLDCLAQKYNEVLLNLEEVTGKTIRTIHIVGGGCKNLLLNRLVEEKTGRKVVAGPVEATAFGNVLTMSR